MKLAENCNTQASSEFQGDIKRRDGNEIGWKLQHPSSAIAKTFCRPGTNTHTTNKRETRNTTSKVFCSLVSQLATRGEAHARNPAIWPMSVAAKRDR